MIIILTVTNAAVSVCGATETGFALSAVCINSASLIRDFTKLLVALLS